MSDPRVERGLDDKPASDPFESPIHSDLPITRRPRPEVVIPSTASNALDTPATPAKPPTTVASGLRARPHGVRATTTQATGAATTPRAYPRSRRSGQAWQPPRIAMPKLRRPELHRPELHRPTWPLSIRQTLSAAVGLVTIVAVVAGMIALIPNKPVAVPVTGSVRAVDFRASAKPPTGNFFYGPYFVSQGSQMLMMGSDGKTSSVWSSTDGSTWQSIAAPRSFGAPGLRFVVLGFADDGNGGLVAVGDGFGAGGKVVATAWHSRDGKTWSPAAVDFPDDTEMIGLAGRPGGLVSAGNGVAWFSQDGSSWTVVALPNATGYIPRAVRAWAGGYAIIAVSSGNDARHSKAWISSDGTHWNEAAATLTGFEAQDLVAYGSGLVAVGSQILTPEDLATPSPSPSPSPTAGPSASKAKATPKPTPKPTTSPAASGASPSVTPAPTPMPTAAVAISWISPDGINWYRGSAVPSRQSQGLESVTQVFDSLVAISSEPTGVLGPAPSAGASPTPIDSASLWTSDDGTTWKPMTTTASALTRGRLAPFGNSLILAGIDAGGSLAVLTGSLTLGAPLPVVAVTPTPAFSIQLSAGATPMVPGLTADSTLGPVIATTNQLLAFVNGKAGTTVFSSPDGNAWTTQAGPDVLAGAGAAATDTLAPAVGSGSAAPVSAAPASGSPKVTPVPATAAPAPAGTPLVAAAALDSQGGVAAVGSLSTADSGQAGAIWHLSGTTWTMATIGSSDAPSNFGSVAVHGGDFVAAAGSSDGARLLYSGDGLTWVDASISGATDYTLQVSSWSGGFIASGVNSTGMAAAWTSADGLAWTPASWKLPAIGSIVVGTRKGLIATSQGLTGNTSWWWSADGKSWQDSKLTTTGGCWASLDSGFVAVSPPSAGSGPTAGPAASGSASPSAPWTVWASKDGQAWQQPMAGQFSFGGSATCSAAALHQRVVVVGWSKPGVLQAYFGDLTGL
jgi:hypothetical protein